MMLRGVVVEEVRSQPRVAVLVELFGCKLRRRGAEATVLSDEKVAVTGRLVKSIDAWRW